MDEIWITEQNEVIKLSDLTDAHLINIIEHLNLCDNYYSEIEDLLQEAERRGLRW